MADSRVLYESACHCSTIGSRLVLQVLAGLGMGVGRVAGCSGVVPFEWPETLWCVDLGPVPHGEKPMAGWLVNEWMDVCVWLRWCSCTGSIGVIPRTAAAPSTTSTGMVDSAHKLGSSQRLHRW